MFSSDLPEPSEEWEALHGDTQTVHLRVADHLRETLRTLNLSSLAGTNLHAGDTYKAVSDAMDIVLAALMDGNADHGKRLHEAVIDNGESVAYNLPLVKADIESEARQKAANERENKLWDALNAVEKVLTGQFSRWTHNSAGVPAPWQALPYGDVAESDPDTDETTAVHIRWQPCAPAWWARLAVHGGADEDGTMYEPVAFPPEVRVELVDDTTLAVRMVDTAAPGGSNDG